VVDNFNLAKLLDDTAAALRQRAPSRDWVAAFYDGDTISTDIAASIAGNSTSTIRRWCAEAAETGQPIGVLFAGSNWLVSLRRLLNWIERHEGGRPARLSAQTRANNIADLKLRAQNRIHFDCAAPSEPSIMPPKSLSST
jgi:transposase